MEPSCAEMMKDEETALKLEKSVSFMWSEPEIASNTKVSMVYILAKVIFVSSTSE